MSRKHNKGHRRQQRKFNRGQHKQLICSIGPPGSKAFELYKTAVSHHLRAADWTDNEIDLVMDTLGSQIIEAFHAKMTPISLADIIDSCT